MARAAIRIVQDAFVAMVKAALPTWTVATDRADDEPFSDEERPAVMVRVPYVKFEMAPELGWSQMRHRASFELDFHSSGSVGETIDAQNQSGIATVLNAVARDRSLGGLCEQIEEAAVSGSANDGAVVGCAILQFDVSFYTSRDDHFAVIGVGGQHFT